MSISATVEINRNVTATVDTGRGPIGPQGPQGEGVTSYANIAALPDYPSSFPNSTVANASNSSVANALVKFDGDGLIALTSDNAATTERGIISLKATQAVGFALSCNANALGAYGGVFSATGDFATAILASASGNLSTAFYALGKSNFDGDVFIAPTSSVTPATNGQMAFQRTSDSQITLKLRGTDGTVRSGNLNLSTGGNTYLVAGNNLSDLESASAARTALGLGTTDDVTFGQGATTSGVQIVGQNFMGRVRSVSGAALYLGTQSSHAIVFQTNSVDRWLLSSTGHLLAGVDGLYDIGSTSTNRPRNVYTTGDVEITDSTKGLILKSPDGTRYRVTVANGGTLQVSAV